MMNCFKHEKQIHQPSKMKRKKALFSEHAKMRE